jgi:hypothetical protein
MKPFYPGHQPIGGHRLWPWVGKQRIDLVQIDQPGGLGTSLDILPYLKEGDS